ncbi:MAG: hypothetical protein AAGI69_10340 [Cyanobacteria bacterium P01_H01_bin.21]
MSLVMLPSGYLIQYLRWQTLRMVGKDFIGLALWARTGGADPQCSKASIVWATLQLKTARPTLWSKFH